MVPINSARITAVILAGPTCVDCIAVKTGLISNEVAAVLTRIMAALTLDTADARCRVCDGIKHVFAIERPAEVATAHI